MATVSIVMGSISDKDIVVKAYEFLTEMGVDTSMTVLSAHRTPEEVLSLAKNAEKDGVKVIIAAVCISERTSEHLLYLLFGWVEFSTFKR